MKTMSDYERVKPTYDARGERVIDEQLVVEEAGYAIDPNTHELFAWADSGMIVLSIDPEVMLRLAMRALPEGHPLKWDISDAEMLVQAARLIEEDRGPADSPDDDADLVNALPALAVKLRALLHTVQMAEGNGATD